MMQHTVCRTPALLVCRAVVKRPVKLLCVQRAVWQGSSGSAVAACTASRCAALAFGNHSTVVTHACELSMQVA